MDNKLLLSAG